MVPSPSCSFCATARISQLLPKKCIVLWRSVGYNRARRCLFCDYFFLVTANCARVARLLSMQLLCSHIFLEVFTFGRSCTDNVPFLHLWWQEWFVVIPSVLFALFNCIFFSSDPLLPLLRPHKTLGETSRHLSPHLCVEKKTAVAKKTRRHHPFFASWPQNGITNKHGFISLVSAKIPPIETLKQHGHIPTTFSFPPYPSDLLHTPLIP